jgi:mannose-6-phosphate isomerase-like protein (cupin superfamily)
MDHKFRFSVSHEKDAKWERGLRAFFDYRDLGIKEATAGRIVAHVIRSIPGVHAIPHRHHHNVEFQMVYVLKGWIRFDYDGVGEVTLTAGSCVQQPPAIRHTELAHSEDLELLEVAMPGNFQTEND